MTCESQILTLIARNGKQIDAVLANVRELTAVVRELQKRQDVLRETAFKRYDPAAERLFVACAELGAWTLEAAARTAEWLVAKTRKQEPTCAHEWVDARNEAVVDGELCIRCHAVRPSQDQEGT